MVRNTVQEQHLRDWSGDQEDTRAPNAGPARPPSPAHRDGGTNVIVSCCSGVTQFTVGDEEKAQTLQYCVGGKPDKESKISIIKFLQVHMQPEQFSCISKML